MSRLTADTVGEVNLAMPNETGDTGSWLFSSLPEKYRPLQNAWKSGDTVGWFPVRLSDGACVSLYNSRRLEEVNSMASVANIGEHVP